MTNRQCTAQTQDGDTRPHNIDPDSCLSATQQGEALDDFTETAAGECLKNPGAHRAAPDTALRFS